MELMRMRAGTLALFLVTSLFLASPAFAEAGELEGADRSGPAEQQLRQVFADDAVRASELDPLGSLLRGDEVTAQDLAKLYTDALDRAKLALARDSLKAATGLEGQALSPDGQISLATFIQARRAEIREFQPEFRSLTGVRPFNHFGGLHVEFPTLMSTAGPLAYEASADYERALELLGAFPRVLDNAELRFREGLATGVVEPKLTVRNMIAQLDDLLATPLEQSPLYSPVANFPSAIDEGEQPRLREGFAAAIRDRVYPAYRRLRSFLATEYLPAAREEVCLCAMKGGAALYRWLIERETTLKLGPDEVHRLGLAEVTRIRREMDSVKRELGFGGELAKFFVHLREAPRFHPQSRQQLADGFARIAKATSARLPELFSSMPKTPLVITPYPAFRERFEPGGSYYQGSPDTKRPGTFYFNAYDLESRFLTGMTTLYLHEAEPGHHFQVSLAQENESLPDFQRFDGNNAFVEGWALYAETLGYEMGLYDDPMQHWGTLDDEMLRAMRLVVDTGLHAKGWNRERAIAYMLANSGMSRTDAIAEVDRYIANPAQALSYKIGALAIQKLRRKSEAALGKGFDIKAFHEQVLGSGALPLPVLEAKIDSWIARAK